MCLRVRCPTNSPAAELESALRLDGIVTVVDAKVRRTKTGGRGAMVAHVCERGVERA